ncbi:MAG: PilZ domain-containing protein [Nannocystaceae bacterium]
MPSAPPPHRRRSVRFTADPAWAATISTALGRFAALIMNEAKGGCQLAIRRGVPDVQVGDTCSVTLGIMPEVRAEIVWIGDGDELIRLGLRYLE